MFLPAGRYAGKSIPIVFFDTTQLCVPRLTDCGPKAGGDFRSRIKGNKDPFRWVKREGGGGSRSVAIFHQVLSLMMISDTSLPHQLQPSSPPGDPFREATGLITTEELPSLRRGGLKPKKLIPPRMTEFYLCLSKSGTKRKNHLVEFASSNARMFDSIRFDRCLWQFYYDPAPKLKCVCRRQVDLICPRPRRRRRHHFDSHHAPGRVTCECGSF